MPIFRVKAERSKNLKSAISEKRQENQTMWRRKWQRNARGNSVRWTRTRWEAELFHSRFKKSESGFGCRMLKSQQVSSLGMILEFALLFQRDMACWNNGLIGENNPHLSWAAEVLLSLVPANVDGMQTVKQIQYWTFYPLSTPFLWWWWPVISFGCRILWGI